MSMNKAQHEARVDIFLSLFTTGFLLSLAAFAFTWPATFNAPGQAKGFAILATISAILVIYFVRTSLPCSAGYIFQKALQKLTSHSIFVAMGAYLLASPSNHNNLLCAGVFATIALASMIVTTFLNRTSKAENH